MTGQWEAYLHRIQRGTAQLAPFVKGIEDYVREVVGKVGQVPPPRTSPQRDRAPPQPRRRVPDRRRCEPRAPRTAEPRRERAPRTERASRPSTTAARSPNSCKPPSASPPSAPTRKPSARPSSTAATSCWSCPPAPASRSATSCPAIARGGTTLVISPLIALMEDQVAKLKERGFAVERIHSGRDRAASRQACIDYLNGNLQFLFIAPERLRVAGFPEMLAKRKPSLIAIDEAHCISQWGHDFRPDYRMLGQYLPTLRPAPVIALTATATPVVQNDIAEQLGLGAARALHPRLPPRQPRHRSGGGGALAARRRSPWNCCSDDARRPAIVYAPTRAQADVRGRRTCPPLPLRRLPRRPRCRAPQARAAGIPRRPHRGDGRHHRLRHGHRQAGRPHRDPHRAARAASKPTTRRSAAPAATARPAAPS